jgi:cell division protein FtsQ
MSEKRKISFRKIMQVLLTMIVTGACVTAMLSASTLQNEKKIKALDIRIKNQQYGFVNKQEIRSILSDSNGFKLEKTSVATLNSYKIETAVVQNPWVENAEVFLDNNHLLHVFVTQRVPVARLFDKTGNSYYLDRSLKTMPLSDKYVHYTTIVTNVPILKNDSLGNDLKGKIVSLVGKIEKDSFWNAQVSQVMVTNELQFELMPVLGNHRIVFGDTTRMDEKFDNLFAFYKKILNRVGWDKYETLDVRYEGQVVASPSLPWNPPVDKAMANMNWVKTVIGSDTLNASPDTPVSAPVVANKIVTHDVIKPAVPKITKKETPVASTKQVISKQATKAEKGNTNNKKKTPKYIYGDNNN